MTNIWKNTVNCFINNISNFPSRNAKVFEFSINDSRSVKLFADKSLHFVEILGNLERILENPRKS